jgi:hydrogenase maturation factor
MENEYAREKMIEQYHREARELDDKEPKCSRCGHGLKYHNKNRQCPDYTGPSVKWTEREFTKEEK